MEYNNDKAIHYAEEHGIVSYTVSGNKMTYRIVVNLDTMKEKSRTQLKNSHRIGILRRKWRKYTWEI